jgi:hypothetical protein
VVLSRDLFSFVEVSHPAQAVQLASILTLWHGARLSRSELLKLPVPNGDVLPDWLQMITEYDAGGSDAALEALFDQVDDMVGEAFGLSRSDVANIQTAMREDAFLQNIRPNLPFSGRTLRGLSSSLASSARYAGETA